VAQCICHSFTRNQIDLFLQLGIQGRWASRDENSKLYIPVERQLLSQATQHLFQASAMDRRRTEPLQRNTAFVNYAANYVQWRVLEEAYWANRRRLLYRRCGARVMRQETLETSIV